MNAVLEVLGATTRWPGGREIGPFDLVAGAGERIAVTGRSGSGKSSLLRRIAGLETGSGTVAVLGRRPDSVAAGDRPASMGFVGQDPLDQLVAFTAGDEIAFALHGAAGWEAAVSAAASAIGVRVDADLSRASGGTVQRVVCAAARIADAAVIVLDEPLAWLDGPAAADLLADLARAADAGRTVVLSEHRLELALPWATRQISLENGRITYDGPPRPPQEPAPVQRSGATAPTLWLRSHPSSRLVGPPTELALAAGDRVAILGRNGAGKSTLLASLEGPRALRVPQDPDLTLFSATVTRELAFAARDDAIARGLAAQLGLSAFEADSPHSLSRGQRARLAVGAILAADPEVVLLDEPTAGQDDASFLSILAAVGDRPLVFATHDLPLARRVATRALVLDRGAVVFDGPPSEAMIPADDRPVDVPPRAAGADPTRDVLLVIALGILAVAVDHPLPLALLAAAPAIVLAREAPRWRWAALAGAAAFTWSAILSQGLFYSDLPRTPLFSVGPATVWAEGVRHGLVQGLRAAATTMAGLALAARHPPDQLQTALVRLGVPAGPAFLAAISLRSLPLALREAAEVRAARAHRGRPLRSLGPLSRLQAEIELVRPVVARALRRAATLGDSLTVRGFDPVHPGSPAPRPMRVADRVALVGAFGTVVGVLAVEALTTAYTAEILYFPRLRPLYAFVRTWL